MKEPAVQLPQIKIKEKPSHGKGEAKTEFFRQNSVFCFEIPGRQRETSQKKPGFEEKSRFQSCFFI
jgi:hypothetical protein